ncbi:gliding motility-associated C-terminal domain-containing protein [Labilibaculum sp. DW002]|uniref:Gliding motility-associated C-terminal domain-containing protein n=1 Tax=Paralabilibaculum antarcticum TaxID=2912572 RepID=A0ABT5VWR1_9BACT|nr:T9SS type B sorting domain-containing protein [Labilibaculum sp. DW002]MDE5418739.1 gliding motility-associated C-terminal domain-containing protein [Labilibaculum sp. DW002]
MRNGKISTLIKFIFTVLFLCVFFMLPKTVLAQYDYEHYVPPFYNGSSNNGDIGYHKAVLSTNSVKDVKVDIYKGASTLLGSVTIKLGSPVQYTFKTVGEANGNKGRIAEYPNNYNFPWNVVGAKELNVVLPDEGLRFFSSDAPFFVNMRHSTDVQGGSLTTKGTYAYGTEFLSGHVYTDVNHSTSRRSHFISVMATEDNTTVNFTDIKCSMLTEYDDKGDGISSNDDLKVKWVNPADVITPSRTLNKGESYIIAVDHNLPGFTNAMNDGMNGTSVTSDKPIVVNTGSWTSGPSDGQDIGIDQIVPIDQLRDEYIVMRGEGAVRTEQPIVVATEDDTEVFVNGVSKGTIASKGGFLALPDPYDSNGNAFISTGGKSVYVYQTLSGDKKTIGPTVGMNFIPPVSTSGIREVTVPFADLLSERAVQGVITILVQSNAVVYYAKNGDPTLHPISEITTAPVKIDGHPEWEIYKLTEMSGNYRFYANKAINVAWLVKSGYVGAAGYYSGFTKEISKITPDLDVDAGGELDLICESYDDDISVAIKDPVPDFYEWYVNDFTEDPIIVNGPLVVPAPDVETSYYVVGSYRDPLMDQLYNGSFFEQAADSDYTEVFGNLQLPGEYSVVIQTTDANPSFKNPSFTDMDNDLMFMAISDQKGDTIYRGTSIDVVDGFNYIIKLHGRSVVNAEYTQPQNIKVLVNGDTIIDNFKIDDPNDWQSVSAMWKPGTASNAVIKLLNNNPSGVNSAFALDSITFVQAVQDTAVFVARVIPNYSYGNNGATEHFCKGVTNSLDVSNGDTSWYTYSWSKDGGDLEDGAVYSGVKSHELVFIDPQDSQEGEYVCEIGFKPEYQDCGTSESTVSVSLTVLVDEVAKVTIDADKTNFCAGASATLNALVEGDAGEVKWFVNGDASPVSLENPYTFNYPTGIYTVRCEAENGCGVAFDEITINVLSAPVLNSLTTNDDLCEGQPIILTADAVGNGVLTYTWRRDATVLTETGSVLNYPASITDREATFKVKVSSVYTIGDETIECPNSTGLAVYDLDVFPLVTFDQPLVDATVCEGSNHSFNVTMDYPGAFYNYQWDKDGVDLLNNLSSHNLSAVTPAVHEGNYKVVVTNRCNSEFSEADLIVTPEIEVNGFDLDKTGPFCIATDVTATFDVVNNGATYIYQVIDPTGVTTTITNPYTFTLDATNEGKWEFLVSSTCDAPVLFTSNLNMHEDFGTLTVADVGTCIGETITFEASVLDIPAASTLTYAWTDNLGNPIGTNSDQLEIVNVQDANFGTYSVLVTDQCGNNKTETGELTKEAVTSPSTAAATTVCEGDAFSATITYLGTPTFEWRFNDPVSGPVVSTTETLNIAATTLADAGVYYCNVELICGTNIVIQRELIVNAHIAVVGPLLETLNVCDNEKPLLAIDVNGNLSDYRIEWRDGGGTLLRTGSFVQLDTHIAIPIAYTYTANVIGLCETIVKTYKINVHEKPSISAADNSLTECSGLVSMDIAVTGEHNGIVWWKDGAVITDGNADPANFVINPATSPSDDGEYIAKIESDYCNDAQVSILLDVINTIFVTNQSPANTVVCENEATNLFVTATGDDVEYKWYKTIDPATTLSDQANYDLGNIVSAQAGEYKCDLFNDAACGNQTLTFNVVVNKHATVTNPLSVTMCETDADPVFTVTGTGEAPVTYQWYDKDDIAVAEVSATTNTLTVTSPVDGQSYYCIVSGSSCDDAKSNKASLTIIKNVSVTDPSDLTISDGANASFTVVASGEPAYSYQWQENTGSGWNDLANGGKYSGTDLATLKITGADQATFDGNQYRCEVVSSGAICASSVTSNLAILTVTEVTKIAVQPNGTTVCFNDNATLSVEGASAGLTYTWYYKKGAGAYETAVGKDGMSVSLSGNVSTLTIPADDLDINNWAFQCVVSDGVSTDQTSNEVLVTVLEDIAVTTADATFTPCENDAFSLSVVATGDAIKYKWYKVGAEATILSTSTSYNLGNIALTDAGTYKCEIYNDLGCNDLERTFVVDVKNHATITNPTDVTMCASGVNPTFTANGTAEGTLTYEWFDKDDNLVVGATTNILTVASPVNGQSYYAVASGDFCDDATSNRASLTVLAEVSTTDPVDVTIADGGTASFEVTASGEPTYSYQWQEDSGSGFADIVDADEYSGATTSKLTIAGALSANGFNNNLYRCIVTSSSCSDIATSLPARLVLDNIIKILVQPDNQKICETNTATFVVEGTVAVTGFTWRYNDGSGYADADGILGMSVSTVGQVSTLTVTTTDTSKDSWLFRCILTDGLTSDPTNAVSLEVYETINVTTAVINNLQECEGEALVLSVATDAGSNIQYKWYESTTPGTVLSTSANYDLGNISLANELTYECLVYNDLGCGDITISYIIDVQEDATVTNPTDKIVCASDTNIDFDVTATAEGTVTYEWFDKDDVSVGNAATLTIAVPVHGQSYYCVVSGDACNDATSEIATLTVYEEVSIVDQPLDVTIPDGGNASFTVNVAGEPDYTYQWEENSGSGWSALANGGKYSGVDSQTLTVSGADKLTFDTNQYRCVVGNTKCSANATSDPATLTITSVVKIFGQPDNMEACLPNAVVYEIIGSTAGLAYEWEYSTDGVTYNTVTAVPEIAVVNDAAGSKLTIATTTLAMNTWTFHCIVKDGLSADETSSVVSLTVVEPVNFDPLVDENLCFGIEKQISLANVSGTGPISFSWSDGVSEVSTTTDLSIGASDNGNYAVTVSNGSVCPDKTDDLDVLHYSELSLDTWSNTDQACIGDTEVLSVGIANKDALLPTETYQWYKDGAPISTDPTYNIVATDKSQSGLYKVEVWDGCSTETISGYVNVYENIVATTTWDAETTICSGTELRLETEVTGDVSSYTWTKDGGALTANSSYLKASVDASDAGTYVCTVSGYCGADIIYTIDVTVLDAPEITTGIDALTDVCEGDPLALGPIVVTGTHDDPIWTLSDNVTNVVTTALELDLGTATLTEAGNYKVSVSNICGTDVSYGNQVVNPTPAIDPIAAQTVCEGDDVVFRSNATGAGISYQWLVDGVDQMVNAPELVLNGGVVLPFDLNTEKVYNVECIITTSCGTASAVTSLTVKPRTVLHATLKNVVKYIGEDYTMTVDVSGVGLGFEWIHEALDGTKTPLGISGNEVVLTDISMADAGYYTCKITGTCGQRLASGKLTVKEPVTIGTGLNAFEEKCVGDPLNLAIVASGQITSIKWYKDNVLMPAETNLNVFIPALTLTDAGEYKCEIVGEGTSGITEISIVRVYSQTVLNASLADTTLCENAMLDWIPNVEGTSTQTYKWYLDGAEVFEGKILHYDALALSHEGNYEVQVTSLCGDVASSANLEVIELPVFVSASAGQEVCENYPLVEFSVEYTGESLRYQWRKDGVDLLGETTQTLSLTFIQIDDAGNYTCKVYSTCGEEISPAASLSVTPQLKILSNQADIEVCTGEDVVLVADVEGINVTYQWKLNGIDLDIATYPEANSATLNLMATTSSDNGYYTCIVSDDCTASRSTKPTELVVNELPNTEIFGRMILCAKEDRVTYVTIDQPDLNYGWDVTGGIFAGPEEGVRTRITWGELTDGTLSVTLTDVVTGCKSKVDSAVVLHALPIVNLEDLESEGVCKEEFELTGGFPEGGIYWVNGISQTVFNPSDRGAGNYAVHYSYTDEYGCSNVTPIKDLQVDVLPVVDITDDFTVGSCTPTQLTASTDEDNIQWFKIQDNNRVLPLDLDDANSLTPTFTPGESQVLLASVKDEHACEGIDILNLDVAPLPVVTTINDTTVGRCNQLVLITDIVGDQDVISWTNPDHLDDANVRSPKIIDAPEGTHTYTISVTDLYGCDATGEVKVTMVDNPTLGEDKFGCEGDSFEINLAGLDNPFWSNSDWTNPEREEVNALDSYTVETPGQYLLEVSNEYNCGDEQLFVINPLPDLGLKDTLLFEGQTITLGPNLPSEFAPYFFEWQDGSILQRLDVSEEGEYILKVEDNIGCTTIDTSYVTVKPVGIEAPNAFIPLGDDDNNRFYLKEINVIEEFEMYVYDRWGELLFKTKEAGRNGGWDGKYKGKLCPAGAYVWVAFINGELTNKGTFVLVR